MTTDTSLKVNVETSTKEIDLQLLDFITIDILKVEQQHTSIQNIITMPMNPIINISFSKHSISWDLIHHRILRPSESVMKEMCHNKTLDGLQKNCTNKIHTSTCTISYTAKTTTIINGTTVDTSNLQPGELVHIDFSFYNITSIRGFTSILKVVCAKTRILWVFPT